MYRALYRTWRPQTFTDVVGQQHVTNTLQNELKANKLAHAYLFTGSRGTGKTSCAKILSKAVNCENPQDGNPCNECEVCRGIDSGAILDVVEIDAASNNGVDNIRDLRDEANYTPVRAKYRVYIIDEVHMLSQGAFNALLKTLEEPPEHVKFILATTEIHKLPATIISRCQRFDFKRIEPQDISDRLLYVARNEGFELEEEAAAFIAKIADGGMRDALSLLDQCASQDTRVSAQLVSSVAGLTGRDHLFALADCIKRNDCATALSKINELHGSSCDMEQLCSQLIDHYRNLMIIRSVNQPEGLIVCTASELKHLEQQALSYEIEHIMYILSVLEATCANLKKGLNRRVEIEMAFVKLCTPNLDTSVEALLKRMAAVEATLRSGVALAQAQPPVQQEDGSGDTAAPTVQAAPVAAKLPEGELGCWQDIVQELKSFSPMVAGMLANTYAVVSDGIIDIYTENHNSLKKTLRNENFKKDLKKACLNVTGFECMLRIRQAEEQAPEYEPAYAVPEPPPLPPENEPKQDVQDDPLMQLLNNAKNQGIEIKTN